MGTEEEQNPEPPSLGLPSLPHSLFSTASPRESPALRMNCQVPGAVHHQHPGGISLRMQNSRCSALSEPSLLLVQYLHSGSRHSSIGVSRGHHWVRGITCPQTYWPFQEQ